LRRLWCKMAEVAHQDRKTISLHTDKGIDYLAITREAQMTPEQIELLLDLRDTYLTNYGRLQYAKSRLSESVKADSVQEVVMDELAVHDKFTTHVRIMAGMQELLQQEHCLFLTQVDTIWRIVFRPLQSAFISVKVFPGCMSVMELAEQLAAAAGRRCHTDVVSAAIKEATLTGRTALISPDQHIQHIQRH